jgi:hypothetical protein
MRIHRMALLLGIALVAFALASCMMKERGHKSSDADRVKGVASVRPDPGTIHETPRVEVVRRLPEVESVGDCAPRHPYASASRTSCIEGKPCRGFGVRNENGQILCSCYGLIGGCAEGKRCDMRTLACVPENEPPSGGARE